MALVVAEDSLSAVDGGGPTASPDGGGRKLPRLDAGGRHLAPGRFLDFVGSDGIPPLASCMATRELGRLAATAKALFRVDNDAAQPIPRRWMGSNMLASMCPIPVHLTNKRVFRELASPPVWRPPVA